MNISIPSRSRAHRICTLLAQFPPEVMPDIRVFVPESQRDQYEQNMRGFDAEIRTLPDILRMAGVRDFMGWAAIADGDAIFLMVDDDVRFECRVSHEVTNTRYCTIDDVREMLAMIERCLRDGRWGQVGIQGRMFQNASFDAGPPDKLMKECQRNMCVTGWRLDDFVKIDYTRCAVRSDYDATLQLLRLGRPNLNLGYWQHSQVNNTPGGCADYRTTELANEEALRLQSLHPKFITLQEKEYPAQKRRSNWNMGKRLEPMIRWRAAYEEGLRNRGAS